MVTELFFMWKNLIIANFFSSSWCLMSRNSLRGEIFVSIKFQIFPTIFLISPDKIDCCKTYGNTILLSFQCEKLFSGRKNKTTRAKLCVAQSSQTSLEKKLPTNLSSTDLIFANFSNIKLEHFFRSNLE